MADVGDTNGSQAVVAVGTVKSAKLPAPQLDVVETQTRAIGLIIPPHDIRVIIDKTADFVAKNGTAFEQKILAQPNNDSRRKFNFLNSTDPYHKYYKYKITEIKDGPEAAKAQFEAAGGTGATPSGEAEQDKPEEQAPPPTQELRKPDDEKFAVHVPAGLSFQELDIIKLTAQFVALNGSSFLSGLKSREENKREFHFLKENHSLNLFFKRLTDAYSAVRLDSKDSLVRLREDSTDSNAVLQRCLQRLEWNRAKESEADEARVERERERMAMLLIDWHDFSVVRTIDFDESEDMTLLGPPVTKQNVIQMNRGGDAEDDGMDATDVPAAAAGSGPAATATGAVSAAADDEEAALIAAGQAVMPPAPAAAAPLAPPPAPVAPDSAAGQVLVAADDEDGPVKVVKDYKRTEGGQEYDPAKYAVSPITGELVLLTEMQEHMRINLIDPKWKDQREAMLAKIKETTKASDTEIMANLNRLAGTRPDVFGSTSQLSSTIGEATRPGAPLARDGPAASKAPPLPKGATPMLAPLPAAPAGVATMKPPPPPPTWSGGPLKPQGPPLGAPPALPPPPGALPRPTPLPPPQPPPPAPPPGEPDPKRQRT